MASIEARQGFNKPYFPYPNSLDELTSVYRAGLIPICIFAMMSLLSVSALLGFITHRLVSWRRHYREYVGYNQYVILIYNLLLADLQQSIAFSISFHWLRIGAILAPTVPCFVQAWFLNLGDVASGLFVLTIGIHTWLGVVQGYKMPYAWFVVSILGVWLFALILTLLGPALHQDRFFARAGGWCWISADFQDERLWFHYLWVFIVEFGTIAIYGHMFFHLRGRIRGIMNNDVSKLSRATKFMIMYPAVYVILTLPIAVGRMVAMTGQKMPDAFFMVAGCLLTSCGWIDALLYTLTRRVLVNGDLSTGHYNRTGTAITASTPRPGDGPGYGMHSLQGKNEPTVGTARSVTIVGGNDKLHTVVEHSRSRSGNHHRLQDSSSEDSHTRADSQESFTKSPHGINILTETNVHVEPAHDKYVARPAHTRSRSNTGYSREP